jgi:hypothetical protein
VDHILWDCKETGGETKSQHSKQHLGHGKDGMKQLIEYIEYRKKLVSTKGYRQHERTKSKRNLKKKLGKKNILN